MTRICPHCHHVRKAEDAAPDWQCPACERAYGKAGGGPVDDSYGRSAPLAARRPSAAGGRGKWLLALAVIVGLAWFIRPSGSATGASPAAGRGTAQPEVLLYATEWCGYCAATRRFFEENGVRYTEFDIEKSSAAQEGHRKLGGNGVPVIAVGEAVIHGYNEPELRRRLKPWLKGS